MRVVSIVVDFLLKFVVWLVVSFVMLVFVGLFFWLKLGIVMIFWCDWM